MLQFAYVHTDTRSNQHSDIVRQYDAVFHHFPVEDSQARFEVGRLHIRHETSGQARAQSHGQRRDILRRFITRQDNLFARRVQRVKGMQKGFLRPFSPSHELQVINEQDIRLSIVFLEGLHTFMVQRA